MKIFPLLILSLITGSKAKIQLKVCRGGSLELNCKYWNSGDNNDVTLCHPGGRLKSTQKNQWEHKDRFSLFRDTRRKELKVVIRQLEQRDDGTYSCPCDSDDSSSNERDDMEVKIICEPPTTSKPTIIWSTATSAVSLTQSTGASAVSLTQSTGASAVSNGPNSTARTLVVVFTLLVLVCITALIHKCLYHSKKQNNGAIENKKEETTYVEIQELPEKPDSGTKIKTLYVSASFPTILSASISDISVKNNSGKVGGDTHHTHPNVGPDSIYHTINNH